MKLVNVICAGEKSKTPVTFFPKDFSESGMQIFGALCEASGLNPAFVDRLNVVIVVEGCHVTAKHDEGIPE